MDGNDLEKVPVKAPGKSDPPESWKVFIVDDDEDVHALTRMALREFTFEGRPVSCISAKSAGEARKKIKAHPDVALILLDVVMETDDAGLRLVPYIREDLKNHNVQIVLRTGQPGLIPESETVKKYDINGYSSKVELTAEKMFSLVTASFRAYWMAFSLDRMNRQLQMELQERKRAEEEIRRLTQFQETVIDNMDIWLDVKDLQNQVLLWNKAAEEISGYSRDTVVGSDQILERLYPDEEDGGLRRDKHRQAFDENPGVHRFETIIRRSDGIRRTIAWNRHPLSDPAGRQIGVVTLGSDVTEQRLLEEQLNQVRKMSVAGKMATGFAQDFSRQLTVIRGYCDIALAKIGPKESLYHPIRQIDKAAQQAETLTRRIISLGTIHLPTCGQVALDSILSKNRKLLERMAGRDVAVELQCSEPNRPIAASSVKIEQVLINLVANAVDAMPDGGRLTLVTQPITVSRETTNSVLPGIEPGEYMMLTVQDTGSGMARTVKEQMFDPFFTTKEEQHHKGLGLSTVYAVVTQYKGYITVDTRPGEGTTVAIYLPCAEEAPAAEDEMVLPDYLTGKETILVVDDQPDVLASTVETLTLYGYQVRSASSVVEAETICLHPDGDINLLIVDVMMPRMTGVELIQKIDPFNPGMKVLYMSGYSSQILIGKKMLDPKCHFIQKPFTAHRLLRMVRNVMDASGSFPND